MGLVYIVFFLAFVTAAGLLLTYFAKMNLKYVKVEPALPDIREVTAAQWSKLAEMRIFFSHHSVGFNIVDGLKNINGDGSMVNLNIVQTVSPSDFSRPLFAHAVLGKNMQPESKIEDFVKIMTDGLGEKVDVAVLKFCYVDFIYDKDYRGVFDKYKAAIALLQQRYPRVRFLHVTVPLKSPPKGMNKTIRSFGRWLLRMPTVIDDNLKREEYNKLIREEYGKAGCVFDLALVESVGPNGLLCYVEREAQRVPFMAPEYTDDGGHLNVCGRRVVAEQMLIALCKILEQ